MEPVTKLLKISIREEKDPISQHEGWNFILPSVKALIMLDKYWSLVSDFLPSFIFRHNVSRYTFNERSDMTG